MTLRRTALQRRTELRRGPMPRRVREPHDRAVKTARRARDTGPTQATRDLVAARANWCCEVCGASLYVADVGWTAAHSFHHRRARGMGGTSRADTNSPANLILTCGTGTTGCHGRIERHRQAAASKGLLVSQAADPGEVTVDLFIVGRVYLTADGDYRNAS